MPPLVSVLLPTRNRLEFLKQAVETVRRQDDGDWELIISDNDSEEDIGGYARTLADDPRVRYVRTASFIPVTENWTNALEQATGRYIVMLGDDDALLPGYVARLRATVERFGDPDVVYGGAYLFAYPDVMPEAPEGYLMRYGHAQFLRGRTEPYVLTVETARAMVEHTMRFRMRYGFNAQFSAISRRFIGEIADRGPFYQSDFPDFYATNVAFLAARRIVADPRPGVIIGVTPKSYGFYHANAQEGEGRSFLGTVDDPDVRERLQAAMLPGSNINAGWLSAVETIRARWPEHIPAEPDHRRFRLLQATHAYEGHFFDGTVSADELATLERHLRPWERALGRGVMRTAKACGVLPRQLRWAVSTALHWIFIRQYHVWDPPKVPGHRTILEVYDAAESDRRMTSV